MVENILQLARREPSRPERVELCNWVAGFVEEFRNSHDMGNDELRAVVLDHPTHVVADPGHLHQVVWNLVQNALRYGRLPEQPGRVTVQAREIQGTPVLEVVDRGPGIPAKIAEHIFEPFFTTHEFGTGLGLYLARQMCEANQALLDYQSVPGGGSCFRVRFGAASMRSAGTPEMVPA
jgi:two-component system sensor histidine kinase PilS (NtrC family)